MLILDFMKLKVRNRTYLRDFLQDFVVLQYLVFIFKRSITWNHKGIRRRFFLLLRSACEYLFYLRRSSHYFLNRTFCSILRHGCCSPYGGTGSGWLHLTTEDLGALGSWECMILGCVDVWLASLNCNAHILDFMKLKIQNRASIFTWRDFLQGFVVPLYLEAPLHMQPQSERSDTYHGLAAHNEKI